MIILQNLRNLAFGQMSVDESSFVEELERAPSPFSKPVSLSLAADAVDA